MDPKNSYSTLQKWILKSHTPLSRNGYYTQHESTHPNINIQHLWSLVNADTPLSTRGIWNHISLGLRPHGTLVKCGVSTKTGIIWNERTYLFRLHSSQKPFWCQMTLISAAEESSNSDFLIVYPPVVLATWSTSKRIDNFHRSSGHLPSFPANCATNPTTLTNHPASMNSSLATKPSRSLALEKVILKSPTPNFMSSLSLTKFVNSGCHKGGFGDWLLCERIAL